MPLECSVDWEAMEPTDSRRLSRIITTLSQVAVFLRENGHLGEAIEVLKALSWGDPTYETGDYAFELGLCYETIGDFARARGFYEIAYSENPAVIGRAEACERMKIIGKS